MTYRAARRVVIVVFAATLAILGAVLLFVPGPGLLFLGLALGILAAEFTWARHWLRRLRETANDLAKGLAGGSDSRPPAEETEEREEGGEPEPGGVRPPGRSEAARRPRDPSAGT